MRVTDNYAAITPVILTFNEAPNIARTLARLDWASDIVVVDSGSTDGTITIAGRHPGVRVVHRAFDRHANQWNFAIAQARPDAPWILALDADYVLTKEFVDEIASLDLNSAFAGYRANFVYCVNGKRLRGSLYPPVTVLFRAGDACYEQVGHTQRVAVDGLLGRMSGKILHDDRKPLRRWFEAQVKYTALESAFILEADPATLSRRDRIRRMGWPAPMLVFLYTLFVKGCVLDGWAGWCYVLQRTLAETMIALAVIERRSRRN